ncbi:MAG: hypothetical protein QOE54_6831 [Streptosporangiaceae bacterium]|nr:hypothetical protein [Streptosporangiaceae bacterium]
MRKVRTTVLVPLGIVVLTLLGAGAASRWSGHQGPGVTYPSNPLEPRPIAVSPITNPALVPAILRP